MSVLVPLAESVLLALATYRLQAPQATRRDRVVTAAMAALIPAALFLEVPVEAGPSLWIDSGIVLLLALLVLRRMPWRALAGAAVLALAIFPFVTEDDVGYQVPLIALLAAAAAWALWTRRRWPHAPDGPRAAFLGSFLAAFLGVDLLPWLADETIDPILFGGATFDDALILTPLAAWGTWEVLSLLARRSIAPEPATEGTP